MKRTTPVEESKVHVPSLATTTNVELHAGAVSVGSQRRMRDAASDVPWSFKSGENASIAPSCPDAVSVSGAGAVGALTVAVSVDDPQVEGGVAGAHVPDTVLHTTYETGVATPENVTNGVKVTAVPERVHVPSFVTTKDERVQPVEIVSPAPHNFSVEELSATVPCVV